MDNQKIARELLNVAREIVGSRREFRTWTVGNVLGQKVVIRHFLRESAADTSTPDDELWWGRQKVVLDLQRLPGNIERLIPDGYGTQKVKAKDWEPFISEAIKRRYLRD